MSSEEVKRQRRGFPDWGYVDEVRTYDADINSPEVLAVCAGLTQGEAMSSEPVKRPGLISWDADQWYPQILEDLWVRQLRADHDQDIKVLEVDVARLTVAPYGQAIRRADDAIAEQAATIIRLTEGLQNLRTALRSGCFHTEAIRDIDAALLEDTDE